MALPVRAFWMLVDQIPRIEAGQSKRALQVAICSSNADSVKELFKSLDEEIGDPVIGLKPSPLDVKRDEAGMAALRILAG